MWRSFERTLTIIVPDYLHTVLKPSVEELDGFERTFQMIFPKSYRAFMDEIGPGEFNGWTWVISPLKAHKTYDLSSTTKTVRTNGVLDEVYNDPKLIQSFIPFANTAGGDLIGWDIRAKVKGEYVIVCLPRHQRQSCRLEQTFKEFITDSCCGTYLNKKLYPDDDDPAASPSEFRPFTKRERKASGAKKKE